MHSSRHGVTKLDRCGNSRVPCSTGLEPMVLPPVSDKSLLYGNPTMGALWRHASDELAAASQVIIFGYSMPQTDTSALAMLFDSLGRGADLTIVDRDPSAVAARLSPLGFEQPDLVDAPGSESFGRLLRELESLARLNADLEPLRSVHPNCFAEARVPTGERWPIEAYVTDESTGAHLLAAPAPRQRGGGGINPSASAIDLPSIIDALGSVRFPDGTDALVVGCQVLKNMSEESSVSLHVTHPG